MKECECTRYNITPKSFYNYCKNAAIKKGIDISGYTNFDEWANPSHPEEYHINKHEDWDEPKTETIKYMPYDMRIALQDCYNFIIEFNFDDDKKGQGYFYIKES